MFTNYYFQLQWKRFQRLVKEQGIPVWLALVILIVGFLLGSWGLFYKLGDWGEWIYSIFGVYVVSLLSGKERVEEMERMGDQETIRKWRMLENVFAALPFGMYLIYEKSFWHAGGLIAIAILFSLLKRKTLSFWVQPTPFKKIPFESIVGFRKWWFLLLILYGAAIKGLQVENFNLALVMLLASYGLQLAFYFNIEREEYVRIYSCGINEFLQKKWWNSQFAGLVMSLPLALIMMCVNMEEWYKILSVVMLGHVWISATVFAKYSIFPKEMNVGQAFLYVLGLVVFPLLIILIPLYIRQSKSKLEYYL